MTKMNDFTPVPSGLYNQWMQEESNKKLEEIRNALCEVTLQENLFIGTTGSDGRYENPAISHTLGTNGQIGSREIKSNPELVILHTANIATEKQNIMSDDISHSIRERTRYILDGVEWRNLHNDSTILYKNNPHLVFPTRLWDLSSLYGDDRIIQQAKQKSIEEIQSSKKMIKHFHDKLRYHEKITREGGANYHQIWNQSIDYENGKIWFSPETNPSIKNGPLRVVQYSLALGVMKSISSERFPIEHLSNLPQNIHNRISYLEQHELTNLTQKEAEELQEIYSYFLQLYHKILAIYGIIGAMDFELTPNTKKELIEQKDALLSDKYKSVRLIRSEK